MAEVMTVPQSTMRIKALRLFKREYFIGVRDGLDSEAAADTAMQKVKEVFVTGKGPDQPGLLRTHPLTREMTSEERHNLWGDILEILIEWQLLLINVPLDPKRIEHKIGANTDITHNPDREGLPGDE